MCVRAPARLSACACVRSVIGQVEDACAKEGVSWMQSETLGYLTTDPANLGTGMRASVMMRLPLLTMRADFSYIVQTLRLEVREVGTNQWETTGATIAFYLGMKDWYIFTGRLEMRATLRG
eukprot:COSAG05_NODE_1697_length_4258_cov_7.337822_8_plen_121_part_00